MIVRPVIGQWEVPRIESIRAIESRRHARLAVPGLDGVLRQDLGAAGMLVEIAGSLHGDEARDGFLEELRGQFQAGEAVDFVADILTATEVEEVLIQDLTLEEVNDSAESFRYRIRLSEYVEPPPPPSPFDDLGLDLGLDADFDLLADLGLDGLELPGLLIDLPALSDPVPPMQPALQGVEQATAGLPDLLGGFQQKLLD